MAEGVTPSGAALADRTDADPPSDRWDSTPIGPRVGWPQPLATLVDLMRGSAQPMFVAWGRDLILLYNDAYTEILGDRHPAAFGRPFLDVWGDIGEDLAPMVDRIMAGDPIQMGDLTLRIIRGGRRQEAHFAFSATPVRDGGNGDVAGFFCGLLETTAVVAAGRLRSEGFRRTQQLFENAPGLVAVLEGPDHVFTLANAAFRDLVGDERELIGLPMREAIPEVVEQGFITRLDHVFVTGEPYKVQGSRVRWRTGPDGERHERITDFVYHPITTTDGVITGIFAHGVEVTERHQAAEELRRLNETLEQRVAEELAGRLRSEDALRQSQKMEAIGQLTGGVAHDFNNLLTVIRTAADMLRRPGLEEGRRTRYIDAIAETAERAARLTSQLLAFARRQALHPIVFNVADCVRAVADMLRTVTGARIDLVTDLECGDCFVEADAVQFETTLVNLAANARDAMDNQGRVTLTVRPVTRPQSASPPSGGEGNHRRQAVGGRGGPPESTHPPTPNTAFVAISIADSGPGIPTEILDHIFEPFFTTKEVGKGTGLGLSQVYGFAKQSGGEVEVDSRPGKGAIFTLYLPRVAAPAHQAVAPPRPAETAAAQGHVLIVEDNEQVGAFSIELLADLGYRSSRAANAEAALRMLEDSGPSHFSMVFSDVVMPGMSGVELAHEIRRRWPGLPVVLTSGYSHVLAQEGSHGFELINKPYSLEDLTRVLKGAGG